MNWFKRLFGAGGEEKINSDAGTRAGNGLAFRVGDDALYEANADILDGIEFMATLQLRTPLAVLEHHGEVFEGPPSKAPRYGSQADGIWVPKTKSWSQMGLNLQEPPESTCASEIGPIKPAVYLPFLKAFRRIVEADRPHEDKLRNLQQLEGRSTSFAEIWVRLQKAYADFPHSFFYFELTELPGVGGKTARSLYQAGFRSVQEVLTASREALLAVPGIGRGTVDKIHPLRNTS